MGLVGVLFRGVKKHASSVLPLIVTPVALGAAVSAGALAFFFNLADDIREQDGVWQFDHDGLLLAESMRTPTRTALMRTVSALARPEVMTQIGMCSTIIAWRSRRYRPEAVLMAVTLGGGGILIGLIKYRYSRGRPRVVEALAHEDTFSFPSGHSFISLCFYGVLAAWLMRRFPALGQRLLIVLGTTSGVTLIGTSRVYLGVHYPSDVLAGYAAAVPWLTACLVAYRQYEKRTDLNLLNELIEIE
jgi:undecaprenyl-diphosphatase